MTKTKYTIVWKDYEDLFEKIKNLKYKLYTCIIIIIIWTILILNLSIVENSDLNDFLYEIEGIIFYPFSILYTISTYYDYKKFSNFLNKRSYDDLHLQYDKPIIFGLKILDLADNPNKSIFLVFLLFIKLFNIPKLALTDTVPVILLLIMFFYLAVIILFQIEKIIKVDKIVIISGLLTYIASIILPIFYPDLNTKYYLSIALYLISLIFQLYIINGFDNKNLDDSIKSLFINHK